MEAINLSKKDRKLNKAIKNNNTRVQNFFEIAEIKEDHILTTRNEEKYFLEVKPKNITVLSKPIRLGIIDSLTNIISELPKSEILCLNNSQNYENNIRHLENLKSKENNAAIAALDIKDIEYMNNIKSAMSTSRSFFIILRTSQQDSRQLVNHALQLCAEQNFNVQLAEKKDIKKMIDDRWFRQGHIDEQETCLITSNETYLQYTQTQKALEQKKQEEEKYQAEQERNRKNTPPEVQEVLDKGNEFLDKIHRSNDAIPGEEISAKISRMELIVEKIFERAQKHPEIIPDLKKLMNYYLPMTVKLLDAYEEMDQQPVQGENIQASKKEIENTLDTLNQAFEKLLDSVFQDTAWDVSSDISVLHTLLAQEGLTDDDFAKMKKN